MCVRAESSSIHGVAYVPTDLVQLLHTKMEYTDIIVEWLDKAAYRKSSSYVIHGQRGLAREKAAFLIKWIGGNSFPALLSLPARALISNEILTSFSVSPADSPMLPTLTNNES